MGILTKEQIRGLIKEKNLVTAEDAQNMLKEMLAETIQEMLEAELDTELGYPKSGSKPSGAENHRNGHTSKKVRSSFGELELTVPRERDGEFEPAVVKKRQKEVAGIEDQIIALYAKGVTVRDIQAHLNQLFWVDVSSRLISNVTNKIMALIRDWQPQPLQKVYAAVFLDANHFKVEQEGHIVNKAAYMVIGIDLDGCKDVLCM